MARPLPNLTGGGYHGSQNPATGLWTVHDIPVFVDHTLPTEGGQPVKIGEEWMRAALSLAQKRANGFNGSDRGGYLPPVHFNHTRDQDGQVQPTKLIGRLRLRKLERRHYEGRPAVMLVGDIEQVEPADYEAIRAGRLPYVSVEVHDVRKPEINSLAMMADVVPFFRLPMVTIGSESPAPNAPQPVPKNYQVFTPGARPAIAACASPDHSHALLLSLGAPAMDPMQQPVPQPAQAMQPPAPPAAPQSLRDRMMGALSAMLDDVLGPDAAAAPAMPPAQPAAPPQQPPMMVEGEADDDDLMPAPEAGPSPAELPPMEEDDDDEGEDYMSDMDEDEDGESYCSDPRDLKSQPARMAAQQDAKQSVKYAALERRCASLEAKLAQRDAKDRRRKREAEGIAELEALGLKTPEMMRKVRTYAAKGDGMLRCFLDTLADHGEIDPPETFDRGTGELAPAGVRAVQGDATLRTYASAPPAVQAQALGFAREYDALAAQGMAPRCGRDSYVKTSLGFAQRNQEG